MELSSQICLWTYNSKIISFIKKASKKYNLFVFGDPQCSSQIGDELNSKGFHVFVK